MIDVEVDKKEATNALHMLLSCSLKDTEFETQKEQFHIVMDYIEKQEKIINKMTDAIVGDKKILALICKKIINKTEIECNEQNLLCDDCIKEYFKKVVEKEENE